MAENLLRDSWADLDQADLRLLLQEQIGRPGQYDGDENVKSSGCRNGTSQTSGRSWSKNFRRKSVRNLGRLNRKNITKRLSVLMGAACLFQMTSTSRFADISLSRLRYRPDSIVRPIG